jgi:hypothetical protein
VIHATSGSDSATSNPVDPVQRPPASERCRARLNQEHFLVVQRVSWLLVSQAFLFIVYAAIVVAKPPPAREEQARRLFYLVPSLGVLIVAGVYASILAAQLSIRALRREFKRLEPEPSDPFDCIPSSLIRAAGSIAAHLPPIALGAPWIWLLTTGRY